MLPGRWGSAKGPWATGSARPASTGANAKDSPRANGQVELRREVARLRMEQELLKQATTFWVKKSGR